MKIIVSGPALAVHSQTGEGITDISLLQSLDGLRYEEDLCANYLNDELLNDISLVGGAIALAFDSERGGLRVLCEYWSPTELPRRPASGARRSDSGAMERRHWRGMF